MDLEGKARLLKNVPEVKDLDKYKFDQNQVKTYLYVLIRSALPRCF